MASAESKGTCFVISPIDPRDSPIRARADRMLKYVIEPAARECGYDPLRFDRISEPGMITRQVITQVIDAPMVVTDLTGHNPNVFYELAIRHAVGKPVVKIIEVGQSIPFDVGQSRTVPLDHRDLASADECRQELVRQMRAAEDAAHDPDHPITEAITLRAMQQSGDPATQQLGEGPALLQDILARVGRLEAGVRSPGVCRRMEGVACPCRTRRGPLSPVRQQGTRSCWKPPTGMHQRLAASSPG